MDEPNAPLSPDPPPPVAEARLAARARPRRGRARRHRRRRGAEPLATRCCRWSASAARPAASPALQGFFGAVPADSGMVFVVVMHLSPEHESIARRDPAALRRRCRCMQVQRDASEVEAEPRLRHPAGQDAVVGRRPPDAAATSTPDRGRRVAVDLFFRTLADTHGPHAAAIVLSGADGDGAIGIKRIKERGGLTIAQDPDEAEHASMPRSAIATGMVDWVLPVARDAGAAGRVRRAPSSGCSCRPRTGRSRREPIAGRADELEATLREILTFLRAHRARLQLLQARDDPAPHRAADAGQRRRRAAGLPRLPAHAPGEAGALLQDLLISVTNFFRDRDAFDALEAQHPGAVRGQERGRRGARLGAGVRDRRGGVLDRDAAAEHARTLDAPPALQVFATDLDERRDPRRARGRLPGDDRGRRLRGAAAPLLRHASTRGYRVRARAARDGRSSPAHDLLKDAPFSRLDLVTCRNLLHLPEPRGAAARARDLPLRAAPGRAALPRRLGDGRRRRSTCSASSTRSIASTSRGWCASAACRRLDRRPACCARALRRAQRAARRRAERAPARSAAAVPRRAGRARTSSASARGASCTCKLLERFAPPSVVVDRRATTSSTSPSAPAASCSRGGGEPTNNLLRAVEPDAAHRAAHGAAAARRRRRRGRRDRADPLRGRRRADARSSIRVAPRRRPRARLPARHVRRRAADERRRRAAARRDAEDDADLRRLRAAARAS